MIIAASVILAVIAFGIIIYPLLKTGNSFSAETLELSKIDELDTKRYTTYSMLKELEFDYQSGILTEDDYKELQSKYMNKAVVILKNLEGKESPAIEEDEIEKEVKDLLAKPSNKEDDLEKEIRSFRNKKTKGLENDLERQIRSLRYKNKNGGTSVDNDIEKQISRLRLKNNAGHLEIPGSHIQSPAGVRFCTRCGLKAEAGDEFCLGCGTKIRRGETK